MIMMAIDLGKARTGVAVCDKNEILASPLCVINEKDPKKLLSEIVAKISEISAEQIIIGLPKNMDGSLGESAKNAQDFAEKLRSEINLPVVLWDERRTTISAAEYLNQTNTRGKKRKSIIDALSASIILENYIKFKNK